MQDDGHRGHPEQSQAVFDHGRRAYKPLAASNGGSQTHPLWYNNLVADPNVELQVGAEKFAARARTADATEKPRLWKIMADLFPRYNLYQEKAAREIPLIILEPTKL